MNNFFVILPGEVGFRTKDTMIVDLRIARFIALVPPFWIPE
jgi:hypothetical protein